MCKIRIFKKANRKPVGNFRWKRERLWLRKKKRSLLLLGSGKIVLQQQSVCFCGQRERETEKEIDTRQETEKQTSLHAYSCSIPNPKFLPTLHTSGKPRCIIFSSAEKPQCCVILKGQWESHFCPLVSFSVVGLFVPGPVCAFSCLLQAEPLEA